MTPCAACGREHITRHGHPACTAHAKADDGTGKPCGNPPTPGTNVCRYHGGNAKHVRAAAERRVAEREATKQVRTLGLPVDISPTDALLQEVQWTAGHVQWLRSKVQELDEQQSDIDGVGDRHSLTWNATKAVEKNATQWAGTDTTESAAPSIWYILYAQERDRLVRVCSAALKAGVEERKVRLAESQGDLVVAVIRRILDGLLAALLTAGLTEDRLTTAWTTAVADVVPRELRAIAGGA